MNINGIAVVLRAALASLLLCGSVWAQDEAAPDADEGGIGSAIASGKAGVMLRYRYEFVDQESFDDNANASTLLIRLQYETAAWNGWSGFLQFDDLLEVLVNDFNSGAGTSSPRRDRYPVVADPNGSDMNQLYLQYAPNDDWRTRLGRTLINLDDQRFVGGVGWRQNEQTYDGGSLQFKGFENTTLFYSYVANVNRIFGDTMPGGDNKSETHLLNGRVELNKDWSVVGYAYLIDNEDVAAFSTDTFGIRTSGKVEFGGQAFDLLGEFATQSDAANNPASFDADYYRLQVIWNGKTFSAGAGIESLGSDNNEGFRTPLATLHAFNGWADLFLATPSGGLEDFYLRGGYQYDKWNFQLIYHDFSAEAGGGSYGTEINALATRKIGDRYNLLLKFADFSSDDAAFDDTTKFWLMVTARY